MQRLQSACRAIGKAFRSSKSLRSYESCDAAAIFSRPTARKSSQVWRCAEWVNGPMRRLIDAAGCSLRRCTDTFAPISWLVWYFSWILHLDAFTQILCIVSCHYCAVVFIVWQLLTVVGCANFDALGQLCGPDQSRLLSSWSTRRDPSLIPVTRSAATPSSSFLPTTIDCLLLSSFRWAGDTLAV